MEQYCSVPPGYFVKSGCSRAPCVRLSDSLSMICDADAGDVLWEEQAVTIVAVPAANGLFDTADVNDVPFLLHAVWKVMSHKSGNSVELEQQWGNGFRAVVFLICAEWMRSLGREESFGSALLGGVSRWAWVHQADRWLSRYFPSLNVASVPLALASLLTRVLKNHPRFNFRFPHALMDPIVVAGLIYASQRHRWILVGNEVVRSHMPVVSFSVPTKESSIEGLFSFIGCAQIVAMEAAANTHLTFVARGSDWFVEARAKRPLKLGDAIRVRDSSPLVTQLELSSMMCARYFAHSIEAQIKAQRVVERLKATVEKCNAPILV